MMFNTTDKKWGGYESPSLQCESLRTESGFALSTQSSITPWVDDEEDDSVVF